MPPAEASAPEYAVYTEVIESLYLSDAITQFVLLRATKSGVAVVGSADQLTAFLQEQFGASVGADTLADFMQKDAQLAPLADRFVLPFKYSLIDQPQVDRLVDENGDWQQFFATYPGAGGVIAFSPVGFSQSGEEALVYTDFVGDFGSGQGYFVLLTHQDGTWKVEQTTVAWLS